MQIHKIDSFYSSLNSNDYFCWWSFIIAVFPNAWRCCVNSLQHSLQSSSKKLCSYVHKLKSVSSFWSRHNWLYNFTDKCLNIKLGLLGHPYGVRLGEYKLAILLRNRHLKHKGKWFYNHCGSLRILCKNNIYCPRNWRHSASELLDWSWKHTWLNSIHSFPKLGSKILPQSNLVRNSDLRSAVCFGIRMPSEPSPAIQLKYNCWCESQNEAVLLDHRLPSSGRLHRSNRCNAGAEHFRPKYSDNHFD